MPYLHPAAMSLLVLLLAHVLLLGAARFRSNHLRQRTVFAWRRHVLPGQAAAEQGNIRARCRRRVAAMRG